jgi:adenylate cyclase
MNEPVDHPRRPDRSESLVQRALSIAVVEGDSRETAHVKRLITGALWFSLLFPWPIVVQLLGEGAPLAALAIFGSFVSTTVALLVMWLRPSSYPGIFHFVIASNLAVSIAMTLLFGGLLASGINFIWAITLTMGAVVVFADGRATAWLIVANVALIASSAAATVIEPRYENPSAELGAVISLVIVMSFVFFVFLYYMKQRAALQQLSDGLLLNILPEPIAERLKNSEDTIADEYPASSILFADVAEFTPMSAEMTPTDLVSLLDAVFSDFDDLVDAYGLEKIKTIGDAYMVAAGVPTPRPDHAVALCDLALAMQELVHTRTYGGRRLEFRIGISSGPVVAGVIGSKKFSYDLWGDSVNTASRMESFGRPGRIQITEATMRLVVDDFICEPGGIVEVKGKGPMPVWFVEGRRTEA